MSGEHSARVRVPASTANLGPGYDAFGLALSLFNEFEARPAPAWSVEIEGEGADVLRTDRHNEVVRAMRRVFTEVQAHDRAYDVVCRNGIPVGRGLGSSAAAIVGGAVLANLLTGERLDQQRLLEIVTELEGHPDNVAAALFGGFTVTVGAPPDVHCVGIQPTGGLAAVVVVGDTALSTKEARSALPESVSHADAAANSGRAALVALGVTLGDGDCLRLGLHDHLHERYRAPLVEGFESVRAALEGAGVGPAVLSGAGPTVLGLVQGSDDDDALSRATDAAEAVRTALGDSVGRRVLALSIDRTGAQSA